jgi:hypothetical protein
MTNPKIRKAKPDVYSVIEQLRKECSVKGVFIRDELGARIDRALLSDLSLLGLNITVTRNGLLENYLSRRKPDFKQPGLTWYQDESLIPCGGKEEEGKEGEEEDESRWVELAWATKQHMQAYKAICFAEFAASRAIQDKRSADLDFILKQWNARTFAHFKDFKASHEDLFQPPKSSR